MCRPPPSRPLNNHPRSAQCLRVPNNQFPISCCILSLVLSLLSTPRSAVADPPTNFPALAESLLRAACNARHVEAQRSALADSEVPPGPWYCIGPFKDAEYGLFSREFDTPLGPEKDVVERGSSAADLDRSYLSVAVVGQPDPQRRWVARPDFVDGYFSELPVGPPPSRNEVVYLYRTVTAARAVNVTAHLIATDAAKLWLNGQLVAEAPIRNGAGQSALRVAAQLPLRAGENRLLIKIVSCFQRHGFSFGIEGLHPIHPFLKGQPVFSEQSAFSLAYEPFASALRQREPPAARPAWYVRKDNWQSTLVASRAAAAAGKAPGEPRLPWSSPILRQKDGPQHLRLRVAGLKKLVLACTIGGDNYDYDDTIWADSRLIAADGRQVWLADLKPARAQVGYAELFVNKNLTGKLLQIGDRKFEP
ncbi:MAG: NPCBM/NEW2 domain-containing protein [Verrucomicrobia bacterium]|nr:NPCBM/NEW2 domain-containing protein [Verrucomicrobiota bacterium]